MKLEIEDRSYYALKITRLTLNQAQRLTARIRAHHQENSFTTKHDVIEGPISGNPRKNQQKFQTGKAQNLLNGPNTTRSVIP
ncbi:MAG TPA: hypothetical protein VML55_25720 [Planctomycetaceae bacterium]|nr:hypothetical protein [Planctomycetaceae bacterium]